MFRFRIRTLLILTVVAAVSLLPFLPSWDSRSEPLEAAPAKLREIVDELELRFDVRSTSYNGKHPTDGGVYWRIPLSEDAVKLHIEKFSLLPNQPDKKNKEIFHRHYPVGWPNISMESSIWYACKYNEDWDQNLGRWHTMVADKKTGMIYSYYTYRDYTP